MYIVHNTTQHNNVLKYVIIMLNYNSCFVSLYTAFSMQFMADTLYLVLCVDMSERETNYFDIIVHNCYCSDNYVINGFFFCFFNCAAWKDTELRS